jgi:protein gp37
VSAKTSIEWTQNADGTEGRSWNPFMGCSIKSTGCKNCYAQSIARRFSGPGKPFHGLINHYGKWNGVMRTASEKTLLSPFHWPKPSRVFVNSMTDLFHENVPVEWIDKVFDVMFANPRHTFQILTKRPDRMRVYVKEWQKFQGKRVNLPPHIWLGTSCEDQATADERLPELIETFAALRMVSFEPLLEQIDATRYLPHISWAIVGGESGPGARSMTLGWAKDLVRQCRIANVSVFVKQLGAKPVDREDIPYPISDRKGALMEEWPESLRVREFPNVPR